MIRICPSCGTKNRVPPKFLVSNGSCGQCKGPLLAVSEPLDVGGTDFPNIIKEATVPVFVDFWAPWCGPCRTAAPIIKSLAKTLSGQALVVKVDTEQSPDLAGQYNIRSIPTFMLFVGGQIKWQQSGLLSEAQLEQVIRSHCAAA